MKLRPVIKGMKSLPQEEPKKTRKSKDNRLPSDVYKPMFPPVRFLVRETRSNKDATKITKQFVEISVKRFDDDEGLPFVWLQMYQESEFYTGYLSGKSIYLPLEMLYDLMDNLTVIDEECEKRHIE